MKLSWSPLDAALISAGSRTSAINNLWRMVPTDQRTPARRRLTIALVDVIREDVDQHGLGIGEPAVNRAEESP